MYLELLHVSAVVDWARAVARSTRTRPCNQRTPRDRSKLESDIHARYCHSQPHPVLYQLAHNPLIRGPPDRFVVSWAPRRPFSVYIQYDLYTHSARSHVFASCCCHLTTYTHAYLCTYSYSTLTLSYNILSMAIHAPLSRIAISVCFTHPSLSPQCIRTYTVYSLIDIYCSLTTSAGVWAITAAVVG